MIATLPAGWGRAGALRVALAKQRGSRLPGLRRIGSAAASILERATLRYKVNLAFVRVGSAPATAVERMHIMVLRADGP
jgi:hypothetical protein